MELIYSNEMGTVKLFGKGSDGFSVCEIKGLDLLEKTRSIRNYIGEDGCEEENSHYPQRVISVSGDLLCQGDFASRLSNAMRIFSRKGILIVDSGLKKRQITVNSSVMTLGERYGNYITFVVQFTCDYPHFNDTQSIVTHIFKKENNLCSTSIFPIVLSYRVAKGTLNNTGDLKSYPSFIIRKTGEFSSSNTITVSNLTTGNSLKLEKELKIGEELTVDVKNRTITSNIDGNVIGTLNVYSSLADMWCDCGENIISVALDGEQRGIEVTMIYDNEYLEAV
ncbi:MAG: phage tail family protein [Clostridia bacterium]|nr:phage tail family protein [Clostridia bacterium]